MNAEGPDGLPAKIIKPFIDVVDGSLDLFECISHLYAGND